MSTESAPGAFDVPDPPTTARGQRTRASLIAAARVVFERLGYLDTRVVDITTEAQCSSGTFYTYFDSKEQVFGAVLERARDEMLHPGVPHVADDDDPVAVIEASTRAYLETYRRNARLMALMEQVASIMPEFRKLRQDRAEAFVSRNARSIAALQERGLADAEVDAYLSSRALSGMISRLAYGYFVAGESAEDFDTLVWTASRLWVNALRIG